MNTQRGSALIYILIAIALMGALTVTFMNSDSQQARTQNSFQLATTIQSQIQYIRSAIEGCVLTYPKGDNTVASGTDPDYVAPYPVNPASSHFSGSTLGAESDNAVSGIRCPGNGTGNDHAPIFQGNTGWSLPPTPPLMDPWLYFNGSKTVDSTDYEGVYILLSSDRTDPFISEAFDRVDAKFSECEVQVLDGTDAECAALGTGYQCLRYWIIREVPSC